MIVGIDLGTSNCAVASADPADGLDAGVVDFSIPQIQRPGEAAARPLLPSYLYLPAEGEFPSGSMALPWRDEAGHIVGEFARWRGARVPYRMVSSAKSWLCHGAVDRTAGILPWGAPADVPKISPVDASAAYLRHIRKAWNQAHPESPLDQQEVVLTVPASFDEVARSLTVRAARDAGLGKFTLLEEPEAAFYDFTSRHRHSLAQVLDSVRLVLVVDVGGGTTDFTLVQVTPGDSEAVVPHTFKRIAVGDHLMLGGDNMDAAVARCVEERIGAKLGPTQWTQLVQGAREAKERLLGTNAPDTITLAVAGQGSRLFGSTASAKVTRPEIEQLVVDGFFPRCLPGDSARRSSRTALQELGLPYVSDPAITRHLADFLRKHASAASAALGDKAARGLPRPDAILLNGGVFNSATLAQRLVDVVSSWWADRPAIAVLPHGSLDLAVSRGAAYYGLVRHGLGIRISGGAAHALYVGIGSPDKTAQAICVIPRGHEQGESVELRDRPFQLALGKPVQFPLYSTTTDRVDRAGAIVAITDDLQPLPPIHTLLKGRSGGTVPIHLRATLTEIGTLELACVSTNTHEQWRLEFELRGSADDESMVTTEAMVPQFSQARQAIQFIFSARAKPAASPPGLTLPRDVKQLWAALERTLGPRAQWTVPVLRELWTSLLAGAARRRRSAEHERIYFQLLGYCLRPGFGYPLDEWRCGETFRLFGQGVEFHREKANWTEFWIMWRRMAPGLTEAHQVEILNYLRPHLDWRLATGAAKNAPRPKGVQVEGLDEMVKASASLEQLPAEEKIRLGERILPRLADPATASGGAWAWALGRLGARVPVRGSSHKVVPPEIVRPWITTLLAADLRKTDAGFAVAQIARLSGDRARDLDDATRQRVVAALETAGAPPPWIRALNEVIVLEQADQARVLGDTLPAGLLLGKE